MYTTSQPNSRMAVKLFAAAAIGAAMLFPPVPVHAAGGGDPAPSIPSCPQGKIWSKKKKKCVPISHHDLNGEELYQQGWVLAKSGDYPKAITVLSMADQKDPRVLNYLGYSHRKSGDLDTAIGFYKAALAINPDFVLAREYLGEGYVKAGRLDLAKLELEEIGKRCGKGCKEYVELAAVIAGTDTSTW